MPGTRESAIQCVLFSLLVVLSSPGLLPHRELQPSPSLKSLPVCSRRVPWGTGYGAHFNPCIGKLNREMMGSRPAWVRMYLPVFFSQECWM